jgi:PIH1 N-terminal domain
MRSNSFDPLCSSTAAPLSEVVTPEPGFVLKSKDSRRGKVFVNICCHSLVEAPHFKSLIDQQNSQGVRIPLSLGELHEEKDNQGELCECYDLIVNDQILKDSNKDPELKQMICELAIQAVNQKYKLNLTEFSLPKMTYKGSAVKTQRIKIKKDSQIHEISTEVESKLSQSTSGEQGSKKTENNVQIKFRVFYDSMSIDGLLLPIYKTMKEELANNLKTKVFNSDFQFTQNSGRKEDFKFKNCRIEIPFTGAYAKKSVQLSISDECLSVFLPGINNEEFKIWFPYPFKSSTSIAKWTKNRVLVIELDC